MGKKYKTKITKNSEEIPVEIPVETEEIPVETEETEDTSLEIVEMKKIKEPKVIKERMTVKKIAAKKETEDLVRRIIREEKEARKLEKETGFKKSGPKPTTKRKPNPKKPGPKPKIVKEEFSLAKLESEPVREEPQSVREEPEPVREEPEPVLNIFNF